MKKGISLIVLVITILIMIILAGAIIITLSNQNIIGKATWSTFLSDRSNLQDQVTLKYAESMSEGSTPDYTTINMGKFTLDGNAVIYEGEAISGEPTNHDDWPDWYRQSQK